MSALNEQQKQLIFDYCMGITTPQQTSVAQALVASNEQAAQIHSSLKVVLSPLESVNEESCPDDLVESTVFRLNNVARSSQLKLEQLLAEEQSRTVPTSTRGWLSFGRRLATAAVILIVVGIAIPTFTLTTTAARQKSWQQKCQMQLSQIWQGISNYKADYDDKMPAVARAAGEPWWKVGYQGKENHSNTRQMYLLIKGGYVLPVNFVCPASKTGNALALSVSQAKQYNDFPSRKNVTYSFRISSPANKHQWTGKKIMMSDLNPLFENLPQNYSGGFKLQMNKNLSSFNSINHHRRGQNVLFCNGSVQYLKKRRVGIEKDDIFTLRNKLFYNGAEVPDCTSDAFLAP